MNYKESLLKLLRAPHISEKVSSTIEKNHSIVLKVTKDTKKSDIKNAVTMVFKADVKKVNTLIVKGKNKRHGKYFGTRKDWKKAYVFIDKRQEIDLLKDFK